MENTYVPLPLISCYPSSLMQLLPALFTHSTAARPPSVRSSVHPSARFDRERTGHVHMHSRWNVAACNSCIWKLWHSRNYDNWRLPRERQIIFVYPSTICTPYVIPARYTMCDCCICTHPNGDRPFLAWSPTSNREFSRAVISSENRKRSLTVTIAFSVRNLSARCISLNPITPINPWQFYFIFSFFFFHVLHNALCSVINDCGYVRRDNKRANPESRVCNVIHVWPTDTH